MSAESDLIVPETVEHIVIDGVRFSRAVLLGMIHADGTPTPWVRMRRADDLMLVEAMPPRSVESQ